MIVIKEVGKFSDPVLDRQLDQFIRANPLGNKVAVPASATAKGTPGEWAADTMHHYVYTGDGTTHSWAVSLTTNTGFRTSVQFDKTNDAALANVTGLSIALEAGKKYRFRAVLHVGADIVGGHQYAVGGTATATAVIYHILSHPVPPAAPVISARHTAMGGAAGQAGAITVLTVIEGSIQVNAAGTLAIQFAQNVATPATTSSVLVGSTLTVEEIP